MSTSLSAFVPRIAYRVDGCPDPTIMEAVLDACIEFCEKTGVVRKTLEPSTTVAGVPEVELNLDTGNRVVRVMKVWINGTEIQPIAETAASDPFMRTSSIDGESAPTGRPRGFTESEPGLIWLHPAPDAVYTVNVRASLKPTRSSTAVDDILFEDWFEVIADGALARLLAMPERWGNASLAAYHRKAFEARAADAKVEAVIGRNYGELRITPIRI